MMAVKIHVPRYGDCSLFPDILDRVIRAAFVSIGYDSPTDNQRLAVAEFVKGKDVFVSLPTGEGKSLCFATLPAVFNGCRSQVFKDQLQVSCSSPLSIAIVVSPLLALMQDQVANFQRRGLKCTYVGPECSTNRAAVIAGEYELIYISPECLLQDEEIRDMLRSDVFNDNLIALVVDEAHCIDTWSDSIILALTTVIVHSHFLYLQGSII